MEQGARGMLCRPTTLRLTSRAALTRLALPRSSNLMPSSLVPVSSMTGLPPVMVAPPVAEQDAADAPLQQLEAARRSWMQWETQRRIPQPCHSM